MISIVKSLGAVLGASLMEITLGKVDHYGQLQNDTTKKMDHLENNNRYRTNYTDYPVLKSKLNNIADRARSMRLSGQTDRMSTINSNINSAKPDTFNLSKKR
jgi:hypothetical protein